MFLGCLLIFTLLVGTQTVLAQRTEAKGSAKACSDVLPTLEVREGVEVDVARLLAFAAASAPQTSEETPNIKRAAVNSARKRCRLPNLLYEASADGLREYHGDCFRLTRTLALLRGIEPQGGTNKEAVAAAISLASAPVNAGCIACPCVIGKGGECLAPIGSLDSNGVCMFIEYPGLFDEGEPEETALANDPEPSESPTFLPRISENTFGGMFDLLAEIEDDILPSPRADPFRYEESVGILPNTNEEIDIELASGTEATPDDVAVSDDEVSSPFLFPDEPYPSPEANPRWLSAGRIGGIAAGAVGVGVLVLALLLWVFVRCKEHGRDGQ